MKNLLNTITGKLFFITYTVSVNAQTVSLSGGAPHPARVDFNGCNEMNTLRPGNGFAALAANPFAVGSLVYIRPSMIRYPGGTVANFHDWQKGWFIDSLYFEFDNCPGIDPTCALGVNQNNTIANFLAYIRNAGITPIIDLNVETSELEYQLDLLRALAALGVPVRYVELGNEFYLDENNNCYDVSKFPHASDYVTACVPFLNVIHTEFPGALVAVVGANAGNTSSPRQQSWNAEIISAFSGQPAINLPDAITIHSYSGTGINVICGNNLSSSDDEQGLSAVPFIMGIPQSGGGAGNTQGLIPKEINELVTGFSGFGANIKIWFTEYDMSDKGPAVHGKWLQGLYVSALALYFCESDNITHNTFHAMTGDAIQGAFLETAANQFDFTGGFCSQCKTITAVNNPVTAMGHCLSYVNKAFSLNASATPLVFTNCNTITHNQGGSFDYPDVYGWQFETNAADETQAVIINMSSHPYSTANGNPMQLSGAGLFPYGGNFETLAASPNNYIAGAFQYDPITGCSSASAFTSATGTFTNQGSIDIPAFSITRLFYHHPNTGITVSAVNPLLCEGEATTLWTTSEDDWTNYNWSPSGDLNSGSLQYPLLTANTAGTTTYTVTVTDAASITHSATVSVTVKSKTPVSINANPTSSCIGSNVVLSIPAGYSNIGWTTDGSSIATAVNSVNVQPMKPSNYFVYAMDANGCYSSDHVTLPTENVYFDLGEDQVLCTNETKTFTLPDNGTQTYQWLLNGTATTNITDTYIYQSAALANDILSATVTIGGCSYTDAIRILTENCCTVGTYHINSGTTMANLTGIFPAAKIDYDAEQNLYTIKNASGIEIRGVWNISSHLEFKNCDITLQPGAKINVLPYRKFTLRSTSMAGCNVFWQAIHLHPFARLTTRSNSSGGIFTSISDAENAVFADDFSYLDISETIFDKNFIGINTPSVSNHITQTLRIISGSRFIATGNFVAPYYGMSTLLGNRPYAGMVLYNTVMTVGILGQSANQFGDPASASNMNNGILSFKTALAVVNSKFNNIQKIDLSYNTTGTAILNNNKNSYGALYQRGSGTSIPCFKDCYIAIATLGAGVDLKNNNIESANYGFIVTASPYVNSIIENNRLSVSQIGILSSSNHFVNTFDVRSTNIDVSGLAGSGFKLSGAGVLVLEPTASVNFRMHAGQTINMGGDANYGMYLNGAQGAFINCITVNNNSIYNTDNIALFNSDYNTLYNNTANGISIDRCAAFHLMKSKFNTIDCNRSATTMFGFFIEDDCSMGLAPGSIPYFRANEIHNHHEGVHINSNGLIADQEQSGNKWLGSYGSLAAKNLNTNAAGQPNEYFYIQHASPSNYFPNSNLLLPQFNWFIFNNSQTDKECEYLPCWIAVPLNRDSTGSYENTVALDTLHTADYEHEVNYEARQALIEKLFSHPELLNNYTYSSFYAIYFDTEMGDFAKIADTLRRAYILDTLLLNQITKNDSIIKTSFAEINIYDSLYIALSIDSITYSLIRDEKARQVSACLLQNQTIMAQINEIRDLTVAYAKSVNNSINAGSELIAVNRKAVTAIYLDHEAIQNSDYTLGEIDILKGIGQQCPFSGGKPVIEARRILLQISDTIYWDDSTTCAAEGYYRMMQHNDEKIIPVFVSPNPAKDNLTIYYPFEKDKIYSIEFFNSIGLRVALIKVPLSVQQINISTNNYSDGCYNFKIVEDNCKTLGHGKFVVLK